MPELSKEAQIAEAIVKMHEHTATCGVWNDNYAFAYGPDPNYCTCKSKETNANPTQ